LPAFNHVINFEIPLITNRPELFHQMMNTRCEVLGQPDLERKNELPLVTTILSAFRLELMNVVVFSEFLRGLKLPVPAVLAKCKWNEDKAIRKNITYHNNNNSSEVHSNRIRDRVETTSVKQQKSGGVLGHPPPQNNINNQQQQDDDDDLMNAFDHI